MTNKWAQKKKNKKKQVSTKKKKKKKKTSEHRQTSVDGHRAIVENKMVDL